MEPKPTRRLWPIAGAVLLPFVFTDCSLLLQPAESCDPDEHVPTDPEFAGCFEFRDDPQVGTIVMEQTDCDLLDGTGEGLAQWVIGADEVWSFTGSVFSSAEPDVESAAVLNITTDVRLWVLRRLSDGEEELILRREGVLDDALLVPCSM